MAENINLFNMIAYYHFMNGIAQLIGRDMNHVGHSECNSFGLYDDYPPHHLIRAVSRSFVADLTRTDSSFQKDIQKGVTLVDFHADWCGPCRMLAPVLEEVAGQVQGKASIGKVNIDTEQQVASQFQITSVPTMILFKDGNEVDRLVGLQDANAIKDFINSVS